MIVQLAPGSDPVVVDPEDFGRFHVESAQPPAVPGVTTAGEDHVWVDIDALRSWVGPVSQSWEDGLAGMVGYARKSGWVNDEGTAVRAHVVAPS